VTVVLPLVLRLRLGRAKPGARSAEQSGRVIMRFRNRVEAGRQLATYLTKYAGRSDVIVLGLPRGGIPVAHEVATRLKAPLDVFLVRKLGVPGLTRRDLTARRSKRSGNRRRWHVWSAAS
jgi:adenine/guanine phosphoribosyltransferase-like PRPP-binding protein